MYASDDNGETWHKVGDMKGDRAFMYLLADNTVVACIWGGGVWYSADEGKSWHQYALAGFENIEMRIVSATSSGTLLMSGKGILLRSTNKGKSWSQVSEMNCWGFSTAGGAVYAGTYANGVYKSTDDGLSWAFFNAWLRQADEYVTVTWLTAGKDDSLIYSTLGKGLWILPKGSQRWQAYNEGLGEEVEFWTSTHGEFLTSGRYKCPYALRCSPKPGQKG